MQNDTKSIHFPHVELPADNRPLTAPIYQSVKFTWPKFAQVASLMRGETPGYFYSRVSNPTVAELEQQVAQMQGGEAAVAFTSGSGAISSLMFSLLKSGDHVVMFRESYKPTRQLVRGILQKFGVRWSLLGIDEMDRLEAVVKSEKSKLIIFESPTNPMLRVADVKAICDIARRNGVLTILDNTFAGFHNHGAFPIDYFVHSLTKFAAGHGDVMGGVVIGDRSKISTLFNDAMTLGCNLDPHAAFLILRGLKTYFLRYRAAAASALEVATALKDHPSVRSLRFPGLKSDSSHVLASSQMQDFGTMISFDVHGGTEGDLEKFIDRLKLFKLAASLGSPESLVAPCKLFYGTDLSVEEMRLAGISDSSVRLSIGLEDPGDLIADLLQALK